MKSSMLRMLPVILVGLHLSSQDLHLKAPIAAQPAFLSSAGQSADLEIAKALLDRGGIAYKADPKADAATLASSGSKSLVLTLGGTPNGSTPEAELDRIQKLVGEARKRGMKILGLQLGGQARRGGTSDRFASAAAPQCDYVIVVASANQDGLFTRLCAASTLDVVDNFSKAAGPLAKAFLK